MKNTHVKDIDGTEIFEGDIVGIYTWAVQTIKGDKELMERAAGQYKVVFKYGDFILEEILPNWFHNPYSSSVSNFNILKIISGNTNNEK